MNDDRSRLLDLLNCIDCHLTMKIEVIRTPLGESSCGIDVSNADVLRLYDCCVVVGRSHLRRKGALKRTTIGIAV